MRERRKEKPTVLVRGAGAAAGVRADKEAAGTGMAVPIGRSTSGADAIGSSVIATTACTSQPAQRRGHEPRLLIVRRHSKPIGGHFLVALGSSESL